MKWYYPRNMWIVLENNKTKTICKAGQDTMERLVKENAIFEYQPLKVMRL